MEQDFFYNQIDELMKCLYFLSQKNKLKITSLSTPDSLSTKKINNLLENIDIKGLKPYFSLYDGLQINWETDKEEISGAINILELKEILKEQKEGLVYFDHTPEDSPLRDFHIVDFFIDEACVGIYKNHPELPGMHFYEFENETYPLHVDFEGYMKLLAETKGFFYWQTVILDYLKGTNSTESKNFKENMPKLFNDFNYDKFIELYESIRIDK